MTASFDKFGNTANIYQFLLIILLLTLTGCGGGASQAGGSSGSSNKLSFAAPVNLSTNGNRSAWLAVGDFNGDGFPDIAVSNENSNTISVLLGNGKGTFSNPIITPVQISAVNVGPVVAGDVNEDGRTDLVLGTIAGSQANIVLLSNGDGTFTQQPPIANSFGFLHARLVDVNGDKHLDLVASSNGNIGVALGNGDGTFSAMTYLGNGPGPGTYFGMDVGDVNRDGKLDIIAVDFGYGTGYIVVCLGNGDGTFQAPISQSSSSYGTDSVSAADFNGDGRLDLLIGYTPGNVLIFNGNGDGTFAMNGGIATNTLQGSGSTVLAADMNNDGKPDALIAEYSTGVFSIALNQGGGLSRVAQYTTTLAPGLSDMGVADLNGDGKLDVVLVNNQTNQVSIILSQ